VYKSAVHGDKTEVPKEGLKKGAIGTIIETFTEPAPAYLVEFHDAEGFVIGIVTLEPSQIELNRDWNERL
jgi:hypothetical protein